MCSIDEVRDAAWAMHSLEAVAFRSTLLVQSVLASAIDVHRALGPGLLESAYQRCLAHELRLRAIAYRDEVHLPVTYKGLPIECGYRLDFVFDRELIVEVKAAERLLPIHQAQLLTYMKLYGAEQGLLINFNVPRLADGVKSLLL